MTNKDDLTENNLENNEPSVTPQPKSAVNTDDLDVEGALAALSSLHDLSHDTQRDDADDLVDDDDDKSLELDDDISDIQSFERLEVEDMDHDANQVIGQDIASYDNGTFPHPPVSVLHRGQLASVIPALLLIGIGSYLTFLITTSDVALDPSIIVATLVGGLGMILLAQWISSSRWSMGNFFIGAVLLLVGSTIAYLLLPNQLSLGDGYPLIITAIGTAFIITDLFMPSGRRIWLIGLILAIAGLAGLLTTTTISQLSIVNSLNGLLPVALIILVVLLLTPFVRRRQ